MLLYNTSTNSMVFANEAITSAYPVSNTTPPYPPPGTPLPPTPLYISYDPDQRVLRLIAIAALTLFCLIHYFSARAGRVLNKSLALIKIILLLVVFFAGINWARTGGRLESWSSSDGYSAIEYQDSKASDSATAFLLIVFSYTGWENAIFVGVMFIMVLFNTDGLAGVRRGCKSSYYAQRIYRRCMHCWRTLSAC